MYKNIPFAAAGILSVVVHIFLLQELILVPAPEQKSREPVHTISVAQIKVGHDGNREEELPANALSNQAPVFIETFDSPDVQTGEYEPKLEELRTNTFLELPLKESNYLLASEVDVKPTPLVPVLIPFPDMVLSNQRLSAVLVLYVGSDGEIDRIEFDHSELSSQLEQAAIDAFKQAKMHPGIKDGQPTKVKMKVLVQFEAREK